MKDRPFTMKGFFHIPNMIKADIKNFSIEELELFLQGFGKEKYRAKQIFKWIYQKNVTDFDRMTNLSKDFRNDLAARAYVSSLRVEAEEGSSDGTRKYLF